MGEEEDYTSRHTVTITVKTGRDESRLNGSLTVWGKVTQQRLQAVDGKGEPKRIRTELLFTARPNRFTSSSSVRRMTLNVVGAVFPAGRFAPLKYIKAIYMAFQAL